MSPFPSIRARNFYYYHGDGLGSVNELTDASGNVARTYRCDSFGKITAQTGTLDQPFAFTGREYDPETGLYYYRARYYDPKAGRFISKDPIGFGGGDVNLFRYVGNDPINWIDPYGLNPVAGVVGGFAIGGPPGAIVGGIIGSGIGWWLGNELSNLIFKEKYEKPKNPNKRKRGRMIGKNAGERERNVGHPDSEEHSRVPKGPKGPIGPFRR